jgi:hypothetical protein
MNMEYTKSSTKQNNDDPITSSNDLLGFLPPSTSNNGGEDTTLVSEECEGESHCSASTSSVLTKTDSRSVADAEIWELLSSTRSNTGGAEHDDDDDLDDDGSESDCSFFKISPSSTSTSPTMNKKEEIECGEIGVVDKDVLDMLVLGDSDSFRLLSTKPSSSEQKEAATTTSRKRSFFHDGAAGGDEDMDDKLRQLHEKRARLEASLFASPRPDQQHNYALQELRRKRPVCLFVNFLGTRHRPQEDAKSSSSTTTRTAASISTTTETRVSSLKVSECPESEPSDLPTRPTSLITVSKKFDAPSPPHLVTPEGLKMLKALGLSICPCKKMKMNKKKHSAISFQASKNPSLSSCCLPALPYLAALRFSKDGDMKRSSMVNK